MNLFDVARQISALQVAQLGGILLQQCGRRWWTKCPFYAGGTERTPSLCLYSDDGWRCFGCAAGGSDVMANSQQQCIYLIAPI